MPGSPIETAEASIAITDPGEVNRDQHLWGDRLMINLGNVTAWLFPLLDSPNGLHGLYLLKSTMPIMFGAAIIAAWSATKRNLAKLKTPHLFRMMMATLPFVWFIADRVVHYILYWFTLLTNPELNPRRVSREPIFEYELYFALAIICIIALISYMRTRGTDTKA